MKVLFRESFLREVEALQKKAERERIREAIERVRQAAALKDVGGIKKLKGGDSFYRVRIGDCRLGLALEGDAVIFI